MEEPPTYYWDLFKSVRPFFASNIPWEVSNDSQGDLSAKISIENDGQLIKLCMLEIPIHVPVEHFDSIQGLKFLDETLPPFLSSLQELLHDAIMENVNIQDMNCADISLRKLNALSHMINTTKDFNNGLKFLVLNQNPEQLRKTSSIIEQFNKQLVAETSKNWPHKSAISNSASTLNSSMSWLQTSSNPSFWNSSQKLFKTLVRNLRSCDKLSTHSAMLRLKGLEYPKPQDEQTEFDILLSLCPKRESWQETSCRIIHRNSSISDDRDEMPPKNVCEAAQVANNHGFMLHIFVQEESFRYKCCDDEQPMYPTALPIMTISQLIECGFLNGLRRFNLKDRWILAVNLAQSLLQLHNGPWLQELWDSKTFTFLCENAEEGERLCNIHTPFVSCTISDSPPKLPKFGHFDRYPLLLTFGEFLLELALGEKLPIGMTNDGKFSPYKTLWNNFTEINTGSLSVEYKEAIKGCLEFHKFIKEETDPDVEVRIRMAIFKRIVQPLERNLRQFIKAAIPTGISTTSTSVTMPSLDALRPKDVYLNDRILFATPQGPSPESKNYHSLALECSNSEAAYVSQPGRDLLHTVKIPKKGHVLLQPPGEETIIQMGRHTSAAAIYQLPPSCDQKDNTDASLKLESKFGLDEAGDELFGSFNTEDSGTQGSTSLEWGRTFKSLSRIYSSRFQHTFSDEPVKVAVLDTGIDKTHPDFQRPRSKSQKGGIISPVEGEERQVERIKACQNFCGDREDVNDVTDVDGHGTHVAGIILQLAPKAELYIARVCQGDEDYGRNSLTSKVTAEKLKQSADVKKVLPDRVEWAIEWAIQHGVHLINMSFGYKKRNLKLDRAIKRARSCGIVIFAAASNFGNHEGVAWPANDPEIAICVHSSIDLGTCCSNFTPRADTETVNFMVVGEAVSSHWPVSKGGGFRKMSGTSTATPVATAIAALLLAFTKQNAVDEDIRNDIEHKVGPVKLEDLWKMRLLLKHICIKVGDYFWIRPGLLWNEYDPTETQQKDPSAATKHAWQKIGLALRR